MRPSPCRWEPAGKGARTAGTHGRAPQPRPELSLGRGAAGSPGGWGRPQEGVWRRGSEAPPQPSFGPGDSETTERWCWQVRRNFPEGEKVKEISLETSFGPKRLFFKRFLFTF